MHLKNLHLAPRCMVLNEYSVEDTYKLFRRFMGAIKAECVPHYTPRGMGPAHPSCHYVHRAIKSNFVPLHPLCQHIHSASTSTVPLHPFLASSFVPLHPSCDYIYHDITSIQQLRPKSCRYIHRAASSRNVPLHPSINQAGSFLCLTMLYNLIKAVSSNAVLSIVMSSNAVS